MGELLSLHREDIILKMSEGSCLDHASIISRWIRMYLVK